MSSVRPNLSPLLNARSVAIVGASQLPRFGGWVLNNLRRAGFAGPIYPVNPRYPQLDGLTCYPSLGDLPERPDLAVLAVPNDRLLPTLESTAAAGVPAAVIFASAFSPQADGQPGLQDRLMAVARSAGLALCGPNCMGFMALGRRLVVSGYAVDPALPAGNTAFVTHSGTVFDTLWQNRHGVRFNYLVSAGNEIALSMADYVRFALDDPETRVLGLLLETVRDPETFRAALALAAERGVPVVVLKLGRSARGAELAQAHSGALTGQDSAYDALFTYYGARRVRSLDEMLDTLELFAAGLRPPTRFIASMHDSGGERGLLVDLADSEGVPFADISAATRDRLAAVLEPGLEPVNPVDAWGTGNDFARIYRECLLALDADPAVGLNVWAADLYAAGNVSREYLATAMALKPRLAKPLVFMPNVTSSVEPALADELRAAGIPVLLGTENGLRALRHLTTFWEDRRTRAPREIEPLPAPAGLPDLRQRLAAAAGPLDEAASRPFLEAYGLPLPAGGVAGSRRQAVELAERLGFPVALKATGLLHKSDQGGVRLNVAGPSDVGAAYDDLAARFGADVLIQRMAPPGVELILGLVHDPQLGPLLVLGLGGVFVEVFKDVRFLMLPASRAEVRAAWLSLRGAALLTGARGRPPVDLEAVVDACLRLAALARDLGGRLAAVDLNPLIARPDGVLAVDALIVPRSEAAGHAAD